MHLNDYETVINFYEQVGLDKQDHDRDFFKLYHEGKVLVFMEEKKGFITVVKEDNNANIIQVVGVNMMTISNFKELLDILGKLGVKSISTFTSINGVHKWLRRRGFTILDTGEYTLEIGVTNGS